MHRHLSAPIALLAVLAAGSNVGCAGSNKAGGSEQQKPKVLRLVLYEGVQEDTGEFVDAVDRLSGGSLRVDGKPGWRSGQADYEERTVGDVRQRKADLGAIAVRAFDRLGVRDFQALVAPLAIDSYALERKVLASDLPGKMLGALRPSGVVGIGVLPGALRKPLGVSRALIVPADYRRATIGIRPSSLAAKTFRMLGGRGRAYVAGSDISSLDGVELDIRRIEGGQYDRAARALTLNVSLWPRAVAVVMNPQVYGELTEEQRDVLHRAARQAVYPATKRLTAVEADELSIMCNRRQVAFRTASSSQLGELRAAVRPVYRILARYPATARALAEISALRKETHAEPAPSCGRQSPALEAAESTPIDGLYRMTSTVRDLSKAAAREDIVAENWGDWQFALVGGRIAYTQENREACTWAFGRLAVKGSLMDWRIEDGGGIAPNNAINRPGEHIKFGWSLYRDVLTLQPVKGAISPPNFRLKPWRRIGDSPTVDDLSKRCPPKRDALNP